jgi:tetratricopeptide (TPR) repeat protein
MKILRSAAIAAIIAVMAIGIIHAQGDVRSATGMPIPIGASVIWGQIELRGLRANEPKPTVYVTLLFNGAQVARAQANDKGYYYFLERARDGATLLVTVGGVEVGSQNITAAGGDRYDMAINWAQRASNTQRPGVVSVKDAYQMRSAANAALMEQAASQVKAKNVREALKLYEQIVSSDPNDFVAWTELGTLQFSLSNEAASEQSYKKAITLKNDFTLALLNLGKLYIAQKRFPEAVLVLENSAMSDRTSADSFHYLGEAYLQTKQGSKAVAVLNEAVRLAPNEKAEVHLRLASLYIAAGAKDRAANEYKLFLAKRPDFKDRTKLEAYIKENGK